MADDADIFSEWDASQPVVWEDTPGTATIPNEIFWEDWDSPDEERQRDILWAGRPTTTASIERVAKANGVSPETIMELGTFAGRLEHDISQTLPGQVAIRAGEGIKQVGENIAALGARAFGREDIASAIHDDRRKREEFLSFIEKGGDAKAVLGERGSRIFNQATQSIGEVGTAAVLAGPVGIYADTIGGAWEQGLDEAGRQGLDGNESVAHAVRKATIEGGLTFLMGRAAARFGGTSLEESFSPASRAAVRGLLEKPEVQTKLLRAVKELGGWTAEGVEEMLIEGGQQINEMASGLREALDWEIILESGASGVAGRGAVGATKSLHTEIEKIQKQLPAIAGGVKAAEIDIERGVNPFEVKDVTDLAELSKQTGHKFATKESADSYRSALDFYVTEARANGQTGALVKLETDAAKLREETRQRDARVKDVEGKAKLNKGRTGESTVSLEPVVEPPMRTANERAAFSLEDFMAKVRPSRPTEIQSPNRPINPNALAPWEPETRAQRSLRVRNVRIAKDKETIRSLRKALVDNPRLREDQLDAAEGLVRDNVPRAEEWKFRNRVRKAKTPATINKLLDDVAAYVDSREHNTAKQDLYQALRKATNLRKEFAELVTDIRKGFDFKKFNGREAARKLRELADKNPGMILSDAEKSNLSRLEQTGVESMAADDIRALAVHIQDLAYQSAVHDKIIGNRQAALIRDVGDSIISEAGAAPTLEMKSKSWTRQVLHNTDVSDQASRTLGSQITGEWSERPEVTLHAFPTLRKYAYNELIEADDKRNLLVRDASVRLSEVMNSMGLTHETSLSATFKGTELVRWRDETRKIADAPLKRGEAHQIVHWLQDPENMQVALEAGIELEDGNRKIPPLTPKLIAELTEFAEAEPGGRGRALADFMFGYGNGPLIDAVNFPHEQLTGRPLTYKRNVVPRITC